MAWDTRYQALEGFYKLYKFFITCIFLSSYMDIVDTPAGSHIIVRIRNCTNQQKLIDALKNKEISIYGVQQYFHSRPTSEDIFLLGFSSLEEDEIPCACEALSKALSELL